MKDRGGEGVEDMGDGGSKAPPSPRNPIPSPCGISMFAEVPPIQWTLIVSELSLLSYSAGLR